ncbi:MAG: hypothetical protein QOI74_1037 [Micromonosporaceae bacterium]|nr:hypothetical protein [Micromonosporaceae bacterium]
MRGDTSNRVAGAELTPPAAGAITARATQATSLVEVQRLVAELRDLPGVRDAVLGPAARAPAGHSPAPAVEIAVGPGRWRVALRVHVDGDLALTRALPAIEQVAAAAQRCLIDRCHPIGAERMMPVDPLARALLTDDRAVVVVVDGAVGWTALSGAFERVLGYDRQSPPGRSPLDLIHPDDHAVAVGSFLDACAGRDHGSPFDLRVRGATGRWRTLETAVRSYVDEPRVGAVAYLGIDVTGQRPTDSARPAEPPARAQAVDAPGPAETTFVPTVAHELRGPLSSVVAFAHLLGDTGSGELTEDQRTYLDVIDRNANRLLRLIEELLLLSRLQAGTLPLKLAPVRIPGLIEAAVADVLMAAQAAQVALGWDLKDGPELICDEARIQQVLISLLANAFAFTPVDGRVELAARPTEQGWHLVVSDNGIGIPAVEQAKLFSPFFRASNVGLAGRAATPGAGLGLMISRAIVELHGGTIDVTSEPGIGTTVTVSLPARSAAAHTRDGGSG